MSKLEVLKSRTLWRVLAVDIVAPLGAIGGLLLVGLSLDWPVWYVSLCSVLVLLIVEGMVVNFLLLRRDAVTVGTDNERPGLRFGVVGLAAAALIAAAVLGYLRWTVPDRDLEADASEAVKTAVAMAEAAATVAPPTRTHRSTKPPPTWSRTGSARSGRASAGPPRRWQTATSPSMRRRSVPASRHWGLRPRGSRL